MRGLAGSLVDSPHFAPIGRRTCLHDWPSRDETQHFVKTWHKGSNNFSIFPTFANEFNMFCDIMETKTNDGFMPAAIEFARYGLRVRSLRTKSPLGTD